MGPSFPVRFLGLLWWMDNVINDWLMVPFWYYRPIINNDCPLQRPRKSLRRKLVPIIFPVVNEAAISFLSQKVYLIHTWRRCIRFLLWRNRRVSCTGAWTPAPYQYHQPVKTLGEKCSKILFSFNIPDDAVNRQKLKLIWGQIKMAMVTVLITSDHAWEYWTKRQFTKDRLVFFSHES